jgi:polar amino acid transport system substrate-binding protein
MVGTLKFLFQFCYNLVIVRKVFGLICGIILILIGLAACFSPPAPAAPPASTTDKLAEILARGTLVVATDRDYAPQSKLRENSPRAAYSKCAPTQFTANQLEGFDVEVAIEIAGHLEVEPCFTTPEWTLISGGSWTGRWDVHIGSMSITPERMQVLYFTQPYYVSPAAFFIHKNNTTLSQVSDMSGKRVAVSTGTTYESYLQGSLVIPGQAIDFIVQNPVIEAYQSDPPAIRDLAMEDSSQLDAGLFAIPIGQNAIQQGVPLKQLGEPVFNEYLSVAVDKKHRRDSISLVKKITEIIQQMHQDGTLLNLSEQYYGVDLITAAHQFNFDSLEQFP